MHSHKSVVLSFIMVWQNDQQDTALPFTALLHGARFHMLLPTIYCSFAHKGQLKNYLNFDPVIHLSITYIYVTLLSKETNHYFIQTWRKHEDITEKVHESYKDIKMYQIAKAAIPWHLYFHICIHFCLQDYATATKYILWWGLGQGRTKLILVQMQIKDFFLFRLL